MHALCTVFSPRGCIEDGCKLIYNHCGQKLRIAPTESTMAGLKVSSLLFFILKSPNIYLYSLSCKSLKFASLFSEVQLSNYCRTLDALMPNGGSSVWRTDGRCCIPTNQRAAFCSCPDVCRRLHFGFTLYSCLRFGTQYYMFVTRSHTRGKLHTIVF